MRHHTLFDVGSKNYVDSRPNYPPEMFEFLAVLCGERDAVWDGACGNGQAAVGLTQYFNKVYATDVSEQQIANAIQIPKVHYSVQSVENTDFDDNSFDLVCIAQALHWFDYDRFWPEVKRVLKPAGIFAAWGYSWFSIEKNIDEIVEKQILQTIEPYWAPQNKLLWDEYKNIPFPFTRLNVPQIEMQTQWNLNQLFSYLLSWSAVRLCIEENGREFFEKAYRNVSAQWGESKLKKKVDMDFCMIVGSNEI